MNAKLQILSDLLQKNGLSAMLVSSIPNITYLTNFGEFDPLDRHAFLLITQTEAFFMTHGIFLNAIHEQVKDFTILPITRENPISIKLKELIETKAITKLGYEENDLTVSEYKRLIENIDEKILVPLSPVESMRVTKDTSEVQLIQNACSLGDTVFSDILKGLTVGKTEKAVAFDLEFFIKAKLNENISFTSVVAFEENAANPHHVPTAKKLKRDMLVLLDFGIIKNSYCSDITRTVSFGRASTNKKKVYQTVLDSQQKAIDYIIQKLSKNQTINASDVDKVSRDYILEKGYPNMPHSLGHGIGIEVHEAPRLTPVSKQQLYNGVVFSIEPGIYLPGQFGVRIEDLFAIENNTLEQLTHSPNSLLEL